MGIFSIILPIAAGAISLFFLGRKLKKLASKYKSYYQIILILIDAVEKIEEATDIIPDKAVALSGNIKWMISRLLSKADRDNLDRILMTKGYLKKRRGKQ